MNLGGRRIKNDELCACFVRMGFVGVSAFLASGNVVFEAAGDDTAELGGRIEEGLRSDLGYEVPTFLRSAEEVRAIAGRQVFSEEEMATRGKLQVMLLARTAGGAARKTVLSLETDRDRLALHGRELYWLPSGSILDSELDLAAIERSLGPATMRTRRTLERLAAKHLEL